MSFWDQIAIFFLFEQGSSGRSRRARRAMFFWIEGMLKELEQASSCGTIGKAWDDHFDVLNLLSLRS
jgi:hypothetical protein